MPPAVSCPSLELLRQLSTGELPDDQIDTVARHLDQCPACLDKIQSIPTYLDEIRSLPSQDTLVNFATTTSGDRLPMELVQVLDRVRQQVPGVVTVVYGETPQQAERSQGLDFLAPPEQPDELGRLAHYRVLKVLGTGGMGCVLLAHDPHLDRQVALKVMLPHVAATPQAKERFLREARLAARLKSDHIVTVYQVAEDRGVMFLAMELLEGASLNALLQSGHTLDLKHTVRLGRQIAEALMVAHEQGLIHRDIKPGNVWIESSHGGRVKLLDFGVARLEQEQTHLTQSGAILGTPAYMAPEQARGEKVDHRADLWSLGVILYELLTGRRPFTGSNTLSVLTSIAVDHPTPPQQINSQLPAGLSQLVMRLLEKDPAKRPSSAREVVAALDALEALDTTVALSAASVGPLPATDTVASSAELAPASQAATDLAASEEGKTKKEEGKTKEASEEGTRVDDAEGKRKKEKGKTEASEEHPRLAAPAGRGRFRIPRTLAAAVILALLPVGYFFGGTIIRFATNQGELVVEVDDPTVEIKIVQNGVVVQDKTSRREFTLTAGKGEIEVFEKDGVGPLATKQFALNRGGKTTVRVTFQELADARQPKPAVPSTTTGEVEGDPDRRAAEWVLSIGGKVRLNDQTADIMSAADLPKEPFRLTGVNLDWNQKVTDAGLAHFQGCNNLTVLNLSHTQVTDAGLVHFRDCKNLTVLGVSFTQVSDAGLAHFQGCNNLTLLGVGYTRVTDAGLAYFQDCHHLTEIDLIGTAVTDAGLAYFKDCKNLTILLLGSTRVTDAGLAHFKDCKNLTRIHLGTTAVTDAGLAHLKECKKLGELVLNGTAITDAGLAYLKECRSLQNLNLDSTSVSDAGLADLASLPDLAWLHLRNTRVSSKGYEQLKAARPGCIVNWSEPNRQVAETVLGLGGTVEVSPRGSSELRAVTAAADLPSDYFQVRRVSLAGVDSKQVTQTDLRDQLARLRLPEFDRLESLDLSGIVWPDGRVHHLVASLQELSLANTGLTDGAMADLPALANLKRLVLDGNDIRGPGLIHLRKWPELTDLSLGCPSFSDLFAKNLAELKQLKRLSLAGSGLGDAGIKHLAALTNLESLDLRRTKVTAGGVAELQQALPKCRIAWDGGTTTGEAKGDPDRRAAEWVLSIGGTVWVNDQGQEITGAANLPKEPFRLRGVNLFNNSHVTDAGLVHLKDCTNLEWLNLEITPVTDVGIAHLKYCKNLMYLGLQGTKVTDAGLAHIKDCKNLMHLHLFGTQVTDAGLAYLQHCKNLTVLNLVGTQVTDAGLAHFKDCKNLEQLSVGGTQVTDAGLAHFQDCKNLTVLNLEHTRVADAGLAHFQDCKNLTVLNLNFTRVTDAGLAYFQDCKNLAELQLGGTQVTDVGLAHFKDCKNLKRLYLEGTKVTDAGLAHLKGWMGLQTLRLASTSVSDASLAGLANLLHLTELDLRNTRLCLKSYEQLKTAMPRCKVDWSEPNRQVAETVLSLGGAVEISPRGASESHPVTSAADLPSDYFQVRRVSLAGVDSKQVAQTDLRDQLARLRLPEFDRLESLDLSGIVWPDGRVHHLVASLQELSLASTGLTDGAMADLPTLPNLKRLVLDGNDVRGPGLIHLNKWPELTELSLGCPSFTDLFAKNLAEFKQLKRLSLAGSGLGDAGIKHLAALTNLESLDLRRTKVTAAGVAELQQSLPNCTIAWDGDANGNNGEGNK